MRRLADSNIPLRTRSTGNPDGPGFEWVRQRFIVEGRDRGIPFIPANLEDNPYLDRESYIASLDHLDSVTRKRLLHGDWEVRPSGGVFNWWPTYKDLPRLSTIDMPIDTALGGKDYTAATAWGWDGSRVYWLDAMEFQGETPEAERRIQYFKVKLEGKFGVPVKGLHRGNVHIDKIMAQHLRAGVPSTSYSSQGEASEGRMGMPVADVRLPPLKGASEDKRLGLARMVSIEFEGGRALVPEHDEAGMLSRWKEQHTGFPFSDHDDWVETTIVELYHRFRAVPFRRPKEPMEMWGEL